MTLKMCCVHNSYDTTTFTLFVLVLLIFCLNSIFSVQNDFIFTRCAYAQGRVKRLSPSIYLFVCVCVCVDVCVVKKHGCLLSYRSKIATK